jgi:hypothetical protein
LEIDFEVLETAAAVGPVLRAAEVCESVDPPVVEVPDAADVVFCTTAELIEDIVVVAVSAGG